MATAAASKAPAHEAAAEQPLVRRVKDQVVFETGAGWTPFVVWEEFFTDAPDAADKWASVLSRNKWWRPRMLPDLRKIVATVQRERRDRNEG